MGVERWRPFRFERVDPFGDLLEMQSEMSRDAVDRVWAPAIDIYETKDDLVVSAELPGVKEQDIHLSIVSDVLSLRGQRMADQQVRDEQYYRIERWSGSFERHIELPIPVQADRVRASYRDGVVEIRLPKVEEVKPREIKIEVG
jgi:HSP20 family protein